jgi:hypothetical protein
VSHALYKERELAELKTRMAGHVPARGVDDESPALITGTAGAAAAARTGRQITPPGVTADQFAELSVEVAALRADLGRMKDQLQALDAKLQQLLS